MKQLLQNFLECIDMHKGHGMPTFTDRALAYYAIQQAEQFIKQEPWWLSISTVPDGFERAMEKPELFGPYPDQSIANATMQKKYDAYMKASEDNLDIYGDDSDAAHFTIQGPTGTIHYHLIQLSA